MFWGRFGGIWGSEGVPLGWRPQTPFLGPNRDFQVFWGGEHLIWVRRDPGRPGAGLGRPGSGLGRLGQPGAGQGWPGRVWGRPGVAWAGLGQARGRPGRVLGQDPGGPQKGGLWGPKGGSLGSKRGVFWGPKGGSFGGLGQAWGRPGQGPGGTPGGPLLAGSQGRTHASASLWPKPPFVTSG